MATMEHVTPVTDRLGVPGATLVYDVRGALPPAGDRPVLLMVGQPMEASGFATLAAYFPDRTVVTYDPRGLGRSTRSDTVTGHDPEQHADDLHRLVEALDAGPVEVFASSGGAVDALALVRHHSADVLTLVAHEPPLTHLLPDADGVRRAEQWVSEGYHRSGFGVGMARFIVYTSWEGALTDDFFEQPDPDPAAFGLPSDDDGSRDDPLLSGDSDDVVAYTPDFASLRTAPTRIVVAAGEESARQVTGRSAEQVAERLGVPLAIFPSHHGGFLGEESGYAGQPEAFAARLRATLEDPAGA